MPHRLSPDLWIHRAAAWLLSVWTVHALLRAFLLIRKDSYGFPFVNKVDWYIFHAFCIDALWILAWSLPFLFFFVAPKRTGEGLAQWSWRALVTFHALLLPMTVFDHETQRLLGRHIEPALLKTYGNNSSSILEIIGYIAQDKSVPYLPFLLLLGSVPLAWFVYRKLRSRVQPSLLRFALISLLIASISWVFLHKVWRGNFRMRKLKPMTEILVESFRAPETSDLSSTEQKKLAAEFATQWKKRGDSSWIFPDPDYPFFKVPFPQKKTSDSSLTTPPEKFPNFVVLFLESHRALHAGFLKSAGSTHSGTPFLDSLADSSVVFTHFSASGVPTIEALITTHLSIHQHPSRITGTAFPTLQHSSFSAELGKKGYLRKFFSTPDPAWDNQIPWLRKWYGSFDYSRERENDSAMFSFMASWMLDSLTSKTPFVLSAITKSNHYPFNSAKNQPGWNSKLDLKKRMELSMRYTERALSRFFSSVKKAPWFANTIFFILADHGFPLGEHGSASIGYGLYSESVWIPLVVFGPQELIGAPRQIRQVASQVDIAPTILSLAKIRTANAYVGHDLFGKNTVGRKAFLFKENEGLLRTEHWWLHGPREGKERQQGPELFDFSNDPLENSDISSEYKNFLDSLLPEMQRRDKLNRWVIEKDRLLPPSF